MAENTKLTLDTQTLGVADQKDCDLVGYVLSPEEVSETVARTLVLLGINEDDIRCVKTACDADGHPHIVAEVRYKAVKSNGNTAVHTSRWIDFIEGESEESSDKLNPRIYDALRNKAFHGKNKNLIFKKVVRNDTKYASIEFDAYNFIAFAYNINFVDKFYKISAPANRWKSERELDDMSGKERKAAIRQMQEYKNDGLRPCTFFVTFRPREKATWKLNDGTIVQGFHPSQVDYWFAEEEEKSKNKKHH